MLGGIYDQASHDCLLLGDLRDCGVSFANVAVPTSLGRIRSLLTRLAKLHATYWNSPELGTTLGWMEHHTRGRLYDMLDNAPADGPNPASAGTSWSK